MKTKLILLIAFLAILDSKVFAQTRDSTVDMASRVSCYVQAYKLNKRLWNATGFFFNTGHKMYFITNKKL